MEEGRKVKDKGRRERKGGEAGERREEKCDGNRGIGGKFKQYWRKEGELM